MGKRKYNYPPRQKNHSVHHAFYQSSWYSGELEQRRFRNNESVLLSIPNVRHNLGSLAIHSLLDTTIGPPPKPHDEVIKDCVDYMESLDKGEDRFKRFGQVINFFVDLADFSPYPHIADQAHDIYEHLTIQQVIMTQGGEVYMQKLHESYGGEAA